MEKRTKQKSFLKFHFILFLAVVFLGSCEGKTQSKIEEIIPKSSEISKENTEIYRPFSELNIPTNLVSLDKNNIDYPGSDSSLWHFYNKLKRVQAGENVPINIVHFGGSHVQAGQLTSFMRQQFDHFSKNSRGERGFVFPSRIIKSNGPDYTKIEYTGSWESCKCSNNNNNCQWGMAGQIAKTNSSHCEIKTWAFDLDSVLYPFTSCRIYRKDIGDDYIIEPVGVFNYSLKKTDKYVQITYEEEQDTLLFRIKKGKKTSNFFELRGISFQNKQNKGITYHGLGVNGAGIKSFLRCTDLVKELPTLQPDLILIGLGLNDTYMPPNQFNSMKVENQYTQFINEILKVCPSVSILLLTNNDSYYHGNDVNINALEFNTVVYRIARKNNLAVWNLFEIMGGLNSIKEWEKQEMAKPDLIHFTNTGYRLQATLLFNALIDNYYSIGLK